MAEADFCITGTIDPEYELEALAAVGCSPADVLRKPVQVLDLVAAVKNKLAEGRQANPPPPAAGKP